MKGNHGSQSPCNVETVGETLRLKTDDEGPLLSSVTPVVKSLILNFGYFDTPLRQLIA